MTALGNTFSRPDTSGRVLTAEPVDTGGSATETRGAVTGAVIISLDDRELLGRFGCPQNRGHSADEAVNIGGSRLVVKNPKSLNAAPEIAAKPKAESSENAPRKCHAATIVFEDNILESALEEPVSVDRYITIAEGFPIVVHGCLTLSRSLKTVAGPSEESSH